MSISTPLPDTFPNPDKPFGDTQDDDSSVLEYLTSDKAEPPLPDELPLSHDTIPLVTPKLATRLMTASIALDKTWAPYLLLPKDVNRTTIQIWAASDTPTDYVRISDDAGKLQSKFGSALLYSGQLLEFHSAHTGPLWVSCPDAIGPVTISVIAVTS